MTPLRHPPSRPGRRGVIRSRRSTPDRLAGVIETDAQRLADRIAADFPELRDLSDPVWRASTAAKVIDCVLSLRKNYKRVVEPRVQRFVAAHPDVCSGQDLLTLIDSYPSPGEFLCAELQMNSPGKASAMVGVLRYLLDIQYRFQGDDEEARLVAWARWARPGDYLTLDVPGFKLAGFQYLRMLFGAETTKPDVHILRYLEEVLGRQFLGLASREVLAVYIIERAGEILGGSVRQIDVAIWCVARVNDCHPEARLSCP